MKVVNADILDSDTDVILHQVNCQGVMGSGIAKQIRYKYPNVYYYYKKMCNTHRNSVEMLGTNQYVYVESTVTHKQIAIVNMFAQYRYGYVGRHIDYEALKMCLREINKSCAGKRIAIPYFIGCGLGGGDWNIVHKIIEDELVDCDVILYKW